MTTPSPTALAAAEEIELRVMRYHCTRESLCEIIQTAIDVELASLTQRLEAAEKRCAHLESNVSPVDYKRAYEMSRVELTEVLEQSPELLQRLFKERDAATRRAEGAEKREQDCRQIITTYVEETEQLEIKCSELRGGLELAVDMAEELAPMSHTLTCLKQALTSTPDVSEWVRKSELGGVGLALNMACVASCNCMTKTPEPEFHAESCHYKMYRSALNLLESLTGKAQP